MPKNTFFNLPQAKKARIFKAAVEEFAKKRFSEASINQIVKNAGISRGSFYQYFNDKEDLYIYMLGEIGKEKLEVIKKVGILNPEADFFSAFLYMIKAALVWAETKPLYGQVAMQMELDQGDFIEKLRGLSDEGFLLLKQLVEKDKKRGLIREDIDSELIVEIFYALITHFFTKKMYRTGQYDGMPELAEKLVHIVKEGIAVQRQK
ncbi:MAG: TetR/AcrR family transcriptional regulator [Firmicutes bacterium]|nr:TetR/AcrR family transcriptional regulator [Bacillota bacterium]